MQTYTTTNNLTATFGENSSSTLALQQKLNTMGAGLKEDSMFGPLTQAAYDKYLNPANQVDNQSGVVQTTNNIRTQNQNTATEIDDKVNNIGGTTPTNNTGATDPNNPNARLISNEVKDQTGNTYTTTAPTGAGYYQLPSLGEGQKWVYDKGGKPMVMDSEGNISENNTATQEYNSNLEKTKQINQANEIYDSMKTNLDASHQNIVDRIKQTAQEQKVKMEDLNKRILASKTVAGFRTGGTEYTPEIAMGILKDEEQQGISRIAEIDSKMTLLLAEAVSAKNDDDLELAQTKLDFYTKLQKEKESAVQGIYKAYIDNQKYIETVDKALRTEERAKSDQSLQELAVSAPELTRQYDSYKDEATRSEWLKIVSSRTGLNVDILKGAFEKSRLDTLNKEDIMANRGRTGDSITAKNRDRDDYIANSILEFQDQIKNKGWAGISPDAYKYHRAEIKRQYGADAVLKYDKAIQDAKLEVDYGEGV